MRGKNFNSHHRSTAISSIQLYILFYFASEYRPEHVERVVQSIVPWLAEPKVSAEFEDLPPKDATFARLADITLGSRQPVTIELSNRSFRTSLHSRYLTSIQGTFGETNRRFTIAPFVDPENTTTVE